ncbi:MAG: hypothetical protein ACLU4N_19030 [Butyricimonas faecihominis]
MVKQGFAFVYSFWNAWFYNLVQGIIVIFIGIDFVWQDRRLETMPCSLPVR